MNENITLPDGREAEVRTDTLSGAIEDELVSLNAFERTLSSGGGELHEAGYILRMLYARVYDRLGRIAELVEERVGRIEITYATGAHDDTILDAQLVPKEAAA